MRGRDGTEDELLRLAIKSHFLLVQSQALDTKYKKQKPQNRNSVRGIIMLPVPPNPNEDGPIRQSHRAGEEGDYSMHEVTSAPRLAIGQKLFLFAAAVLIGFVGGRSIAESAGAISADQQAGERFLEGPGGGWVSLAIVLLALFVGAALRTLILLAQRVIALLTRVETRPEPWIAMTIIGCGVLCLLSAIAFQWHLSSVSAGVSATLPQVDVPGMPKGAAGLRIGGVTIHGRASLMAPVTTLIVLLAGVATIAIGIWSSIPKRGSTKIPNESAVAQAIQVSR